jgi:hypothetical protein
MGLAMLQQSAGVDTSSDNESDNKFHTTNDVMTTWVAVAALGGMYRATSSMNCSHASVTSCTTDSPRIKIRTHAWRINWQHRERRQHLKATDAAYPHNLEYLGLVPGCFAGDV